MRLMWVANKLVVHLSVKVERNSGINRRLGAFRQELARNVLPG
jgi:hypothetical protein